MKRGKELEESRSSICWRGILKELLTLRLLMKGPIAERHARHVMPFSGIICQIYYS